MGVTCFRVPRFSTMVVGGVLILAGLGAPARASQVRPMTLEEMVERAGVVVAGRCAAVRVVEDEAHRMPVTELTFDVREWIKGPRRDRLTIRQPGAMTRAGGRGGFAGLPAFEVGEEVVLLLYPESRSGMTSPVGLGQGKFTVRTDKQGRRWAIGAFGGLARDEPGSADTPHAAGAAGGRSGGVAEEVLLHRLRELVRRHTARTAGR